MTNGVLKIGRRRDFDNAVKSFEGKRVEITVDEFDRASQQFKNYYFGAMGYLSGLTGYTKDELHEMNELDFNSKPVPVVDKKTGEVVGERVIPQSTRRMKKGEFQEYLERVRRGWAERGYNIPDQYWEKESMRNT